MARPSLPPLGGAVLVHGTWSNPGDWQWTRRRLEDEGVVVQVPDLPSHRSARAGLLEDVDEVRSVIAALPAPVVVAGWSYGCEVIGVAADGQDSVVRLVFVSGAPSPVRFETRGVEVFDAEPVITVDRVAGTFVLDDRWWVHEEKGLTLPPEAQAHIRTHPRRPASIRSYTDPVLATAWTRIPSTVLLGRDDELVGEQERRWIADHFDDVRELDTDHFVPFNRPGAVADVVLEALRGADRPA
ncbi:alpha/beta fold hydrolase [Naasia sp. SYSU D00948]|uniref:alpha/beta fold hydrolase n=1 Tax=Naasia sp. SYSU D00948 TaxID=2817379 RepID=UPI001B3135D9|nr:alpha/beta hydrolase [Naasia sp. SYSU D00948]